MAVPYQAGDLSAALASLLNAFLHALPDNLSRASSFHIDCAGNPL